MLSIIWSTKEPKIDSEPDIRKSPKMNQIVTMQMMWGAMTRIPRRVPTTMIYIKWRGAITRIRDGFRPVWYIWWLIFTAGLIPPATKDTVSVETRGPTNEQKQSKALQKTVIVLSCVLLSNASRLSPLGCTFQLHSGNLAEQNVLKARKSQSRARLHAHERTTKWPCLGTGCYRRTEKATKTIIHHKNDPSSNLED